MTIRKIGEPFRGASVVNCQHPDHTPPDVSAVSDAGMYEHTCPKCGRRTIFSVPVKQEAKA